MWRELSPHTKLPHPEQKESVPSARKHTGKPGQLPLKTFTHPVVLHSHSDPDPGSKDCGDPHMSEDLSGAPLTHPRQSRYFGEWKSFLKEV
jgi:hypothetical protein